MEQLPLLYICKLQRSGDLQIIFKIPIKDESQSPRFIAQKGRNIILKNLEEIMTHAQNHSEFDIIPGEVCPVSDSSTFREVRRHCLAQGLVEKHQSLIYHFSDQKRYCFYDFVAAKDNRGGTTCKTARLSHDENPFRYAWENDIPYDIVIGSTDATISLEVQALHRQGITLTGWELPEPYSEEVTAVCFVQKRRVRGEHHLEGTIAYCKLNGDSTQTDYELGSLKDAAIALNYLQLHNISIEQAAKDLQDEIEMIDAVNQMEADIAEYNARTWVDDLPEELQDFADQFPDQDAFEHYMEDRW